jgi:outer membrane immunogenic protein
LLARQELDLQMRASVVCGVAVLGVLSGAGARADDPWGPLQGPPTQFNGVEFGGQFAAAIGGSGDVDLSGAGGGAYAGFNLQNGPIVGGIEADTLFGSINGDGRGGTLTEDWVSSLRIRGGWAFGPVLAFATVGPAWASSNFSRSGFNFDKQLHGDTFGFGGEFALTRTFSARAEFRHYDFGSANYYMPASTEKIESGNNLLMVGVGAHF